MSLPLSAVRSLDAAGISDPELRAGYLACRDLLARHGRTYHLATTLLPPARRPYVWALYGFARYADEIVDDLAAGDPATRAAQFHRWARERTAQLAGVASTDPIGVALVDTVRTWDIPVEHFEVFLASMRADLTVTQYPTFDDLAGYMDGSAAVIGLQMLPILSADRGGPLTPAAGHAAALGIAFQLTNFIRDVGEDLARGRLYLPVEDLDRFGLARADLEQGPDPVRLADLMAFQINRARHWYHRAEPGVDLLAPQSRACIGTALRLYATILDRVERDDYRVLDRRATVPTRTRLRIAAPAYLRARRSWPAARSASRSQHIHVHSTNANPNIRSSTGA